MLAEKDLTACLTELRKLFSKEADCAGNGLN